MVAQLALAVLVMGTASVAFVTLRSTLHRSPGYESDGVFTARVAPPTAADARARSGEYDQLLRNVRAASGVRRAALSSALPIAPLPQALVSTTATAGSGGADTLDVDLLAVSPGFFEVGPCPRSEGATLPTATTGTSSRSPSSAQRLRGGCGLARMPLAGACGSNRASDSRRRLSGSVAIS